MKKIIKRTLVSFLIFVFSLAPISPQALLNSSQADDEITSLSGDYETDLVINDKWSVIEEGKTVTVKNGADITFTKKYSNLMVSGKLIIEGTKDNPTIIKGNFDYEAFYIAIGDGADVKIKNAEIIGGGYSVYLLKGLTTKALARNYFGAIDISGGTTTIEDTTFKNNEYAITTGDISNNSLKVNYSKFIENQNDVEDLNGSDFTNNYWDSLGDIGDVSEEESCAHYKTVEACLPRSYGNFKIDPWQENENFIHNDGASSVLFLPGIQSSRLYKEHSLDEDQLWEPTNRNEDIKDLYLKSDGTSVDESIYTKDIIDEAYEHNIYKSFMSYMDGLVTDNTIKEWKAIPYDWRLSLQSTVDDGIRLEDGNMLDILKEVQTLAENSNTGKVTIIGHSNGGLMGKVLIDRLENIGKENLIDKFIMVATPQVGTPKALVGLLHGDKLDIPVLLNKKTARELAENMSSAYNLLPSSKYFEYVTTPVVEFEKDVKDIYDFRKIYGENIDSKEELDEFLTGDGGERKDPRSGDTDSPNVLDDKLLSKANDIHNNLLDNWSAPENTEVIQIAGWGLDTIVGIKYDDCDLLFCPDKLSNLDRKLIFKKDGDKTVVVPSAIIMNEEEIYYVNINEYNKGLTKDRDHASILEIPNLQEFLKNIINNKRDLSTYITKEKPVVKNEDKSLRYRMHSPVAVHLYDGENNHTGLTDNSNPKSDLVYYEENIPNSYYLEFGETKYLGSSKDAVSRVELIGEGTGTFTFEIEELKGENIDKTTVFKDVPVIKDMRANIDISENIGIMEIDWNNDDKIDATIDTEKPNSSEIVSIQLLKEVIKSSNINPILKNHFLNEIKVAEKQIKKGKNKNAGKILEILEKQIEIFSDKKMFKKLRINKVEAENLIKIIETVRLNLIK